MYSYYITGNTYHIKELLKKVKPQRKNFKGWWHYNYDFKAWELSVPNNFNSKKFQNIVQLFCDENDLKLEVLEFTKPLTKSISDFDSIEAFFAYFHGHNNRILKM